MELFALAAAALFVLGAPALATVSWRRSLGTPVDTVEVVALAYGGIAVVTLAIWWGAWFAGFSEPVILASTLSISTLVSGCALMGRTRRATAGTVAELTGHHDGRVVPEAVATRRPPWRLPQPSGNPYFFLLLGAGVVFAVMSWLPFLTYGLSRADGVHRMAMSDWYKHLVTGSALASADVFPPANPFAHSIDSAPYYYGFHLVAASLSRLAGGITGGAPAALLYPALLGLTLMTAVATPFVAFTAARTLVHGRAGGAGDTQLVALLAAFGATFLAGLDLLPLFIDTLINIVSGALPTGLAGLRAVIPSTHLDYWIHHNERQFNAPYLTTIWAPQHMAAVLVALLAIHLVIQRRFAADRGDEASRRGNGLLMLLLPTLLLAALPALSAYVALGLGIAAAGALGIETFRARCPPWRTTAWGLWSIPGAGALLLALPVVLVLAAGSAAGGLVVHVSGAGGWVNGAVFSAALGSSWYAGVLDSLAVYALELGLVGVLAAIEIRRLAARERWQPHQRHVVWMVLSLMVCIVFVRPPVGGPNNLYARPLLLVWFLLAPFAAMRWARWSGLLPGGRGGDGGGAARARRRRGAPTWAVAALTLCLLANGYALLGVLLEGALFWPTSPPTVEAAAWTNDNAAPGAVVAIAPRDYQSSFGYWLRRPLALADERHAMLFGATAAEYERLASRLEEAREAADPGVVIGALRAVEADLFLVGRAGGDPPWRGSDCFATRFENDEWLLLEAVPGSCRSVDR